MTDWEKEERRAAERDAPEEYGDYRDEIAEDRDRQLQAALMRKRYGS